MLSAFITGGAALSVVGSRTTTEPSVLITGLTMMMSIPGAITQFVDALTKAEAGFNSFIRLSRFASISGEDHPLEPRWY